MIRALIAANIKKYRKSAGLTQKTFAGLCGVSVSFIAHIETTSCSVSINFIEKVCDVLKIKPTQLFDGLNDSAE